MGIEEFLVDRTEKIGFEIGMILKEMEKNQIFTQNLLTLTDSSISTIAQLVGVSEGFVLDQKKRIEQKNDRTFICSYELAITNLPKYPLIDLQGELMKSRHNNLSENEHAELKNVISKFYANQAIAEANTI